MGDRRQLSGGEERQLGPALGIGQGRWIEIDQAARGRQGVEATGRCRPQGGLALYLVAPVAQEGPIHPVGIAAAGVDGAGVHQELIPIRQHPGGLGLEGGGHPPVALAGPGFHIPVPGHHLGAHGAGQGRQQGERIAAQQQQPGAGLSPALGQLPQAFDQKPQPRRCHGVGRQELGVEHIDAG